MPRTEEAQARGLIVRSRAPAKINLALHVTGRRADGYHLIETLAVFTEIGDELTVAPAQADSFTLDGPFANAVPGGADNLVLRARDMFRQRHGGGPVAIGLTKNLPPASGIGGGSSDAAACLATLARLSGRRQGLREIGAALGADLPMCLAAEPLIASGVGEATAPLSAFPALHLVLVNPGVPVPTGAIFKFWAPVENGPMPEPCGLADAGAVAAWMARSRNDLQAPAIAYASVIAECRDALLQAGALAARMSGSGATAFGIFADERSALRAWEQLAARRPSWFIAPTRSHAPGEFERWIRP